MNIDAHRLLWQQLNKLYVHNDDNMFVLSIGKYLLYSDYSLVSLPQRAALNTFNLVDDCIACNVNYSPKGSKISTQWEQLLYHGKGPPAGPAQKPAFEHAKALLYVNYETKERSELYKKYIKAKADFARKKVLLKIECKDTYGDNWKTIYDQLLGTTEEYQRFEPLDREVSPLLQAIEEWVDGPLITAMAPMKEIFEDNERSVVLSDGESATYRYVSMIPTNWYQWLDPNQPDDDSWMHITVDRRSSDDDDLYKKYITLGGKPSTGNSQNVTIDLKVRSVQIHRPWIDLSALNIHGWTIPGVKSGAWSTGIIDSSNNGSFPLLSTQMIVAKDVTITGTNFNHELEHTVKVFNPSIDDSLLGDLLSVGGPLSIGGPLSVGSGISEITNLSEIAGISEIASISGIDDFRLGIRSNSIKLKGTQVIGYVCTLLPKYPA